MKIKKYKENFLSAAIKALERGEVIVYPTDTLYAMGADIYNDDAVKKVFMIKNRPFGHPFSVAVSSLKDIDKISYIDKSVERVVEQFLPGSLTLLLKKKSSVSKIVTGGLDTIAIRMPNNEIALNLLSRFGPLTATSANIHGKKTSCVINDLTMQFRSKVSVYLDGGRLDAPPSTIVDLTSKKPIIVRQGAIRIEEILKVI